MTREITGAERYRSRVRGSLLGGAIGDALGAPVEFWSLDRIQGVCGPEGVRSYLETESAPLGAVTDDTQLTLFTVEGLIRAGLRRDRGIGLTVAVVHAAYDDWLETQLRPGPGDQPRGWLMAQPWLYARRAPGQTCLDALTAARRRGRTGRYGGRADNDSKGCGGVMRSAPFGLLPTSGADRGWVMDTAAETSGYTHGHPTGRLAAGALAVIIRVLQVGETLDAAVDAALELVARQPEHEETTGALTAARETARRNPASAEALEALGAGWVAEEALAIAVYAALSHPEPEPDGVLDALALAVTHSGDSDSTGAICGNLLGAWHGETALPPELVFAVEGRGTILELADDLVFEFTHRARLHGEYGPDTGWTGRY